MTVFEWGVSFIRSLFGNLSPNRRVRKTLQSAARLSYGSDINEEQAKNILSKLEKKRDLGQLLEKNWNF